MRAHDRTFRGFFSYGMHLICFKGIVNKTQLHQLSGKQDSYDGGTDETTIHRPVIMSRGLERGATEDIFSDTKSDRKRGHVGHRRQMIRWVERFQSFVNQITHNL